MRGPDYYLPALILWTGLAFKVPALRRDRREPTLRAVCAVLLLAGAGFAIGAPPSIALINRLTGVPNFAAPLTYSIVTAYSAACFILMLLWRGGEAPRLRSLVRRWTLAYALVCVALWALFAAGRAPVEQQRNFDTYYAHTPFIREMIVLYLTAHVTAALVTTLLCWRWARLLQGWQRAGLIVITAGWLLNLLFGVVKSTAVAARWADQDWDAINTSVAPIIVSLAGALVAAGYLLPVLVPTAVETLLGWRTYLQLNPLWHALAATENWSTYQPRLSRLASPRIRLVSRESSLQYGLLRLAPYADEAVREDAYDRARAAGASEVEAKAVGTAAMVVVAVDRFGRAVEDEGDPVLEQLASDTAQLVRIARAIRTSAVVTQIVSEYMRAPSKPIAAPRGAADSGERLT
ncbi:MAB_1171c family putative transporter [Streptomyces sp. NBC_01304]|uniref:MAB_1171c family putative transporter n=1 Tax=Streptomyces sp. NBC_01304 TaxID=2903818 RepID=UPI002E11EBFF|nr:hypothetical protein OG430_41440 [Streptomyces sp. NBC_01304]